MNLHLCSLCSFVLLRLSNLSLAAIVQITGALNKKATKPTGTQMGLVTPIMTVSVKLKFFEVCGPVFDEVATVSALGEF